MREKVYVEILNPNDHIDLNSITKRVVVDDTTGALVIYLGVVKGTKDDKTVQELFFKEEPDSLKKLKDCVEEAVKGFNIKSAYVAHYNGSRRPGEPIMVIAVSSENRENAIEATRAIVNSIKAFEPLTKKEIFLK